MCVLSRFVMSNSAIPWTLALQASLSIEFSGQEILERVASSSSRGLS